MTEREASFQIRPHTPFALPAPAADLVPPGGDDPETEKSYFDPAGWDTEVNRPVPPDDRDRVANNIGRAEGAGSALLIVSDFHLADGSVAGDDFLNSHLHHDEEFDLETGYYPAGQSRARLVASVVTFARQRLRQQMANSVQLDIVLNGDVVNFLEMKGRGGTLVSARHRPLFRTLSILCHEAAVYWLRGNHDYAVPAGPWRPGEFYVNSRLRTLVEHGDYWDKENWPPGLANKGSQLVLAGAAAFEGLATVTKSGELKYLMSGVDNLRPWNDDALDAFLKRRRKHSDVALVASVASKVKFLGAADDSAAYKGALSRQAGPHHDWLMVQGHTHVPAFAAGVYYNTGSWIASLVAPKGREQHLEVFPFLLLYTDRQGRRVEEYYTTGQEQPADVPLATLHTQESVNQIRRVYGYDELTAG